MKKQVILSVQFLIIGLLILISFPLSVCADRMDDAVEEAVELLKDRGLGKIKRLELIIEVINKDSQDFDREARLIQSSLYSSLQSKFPQAKLMLKEEALKDNRLLFPVQDFNPDKKESEITCRSRLGGVLKYYYRSAA